MPVTGGKTIGELDAGAGLTATSFIEVQNDAGESVKITLADLAAWVKAEESIVSLNLPYRGARVRLSANVSPGTSGFFTISWDTEDRDTDALWSLAQPTRFVIPAGITKIKLLSYARSGGGATSRHLFFLKNGGYFIGGGGMGYVGINIFDNCLVSDVIDVVPGDYFELQTWGSNAALTGGAGSPTGLATYFSIEVVEAS